MNQIRVKSLVATKEIDRPLCRTKIVVLCFIYPKTTKLYVVLAGLLTYPAH